jgi:ATP adenylyltransferase/5',5'''-P-1,P-4-tetraphosphate phosphorylase II
MMQQKVHDATFQEQVDRLIDEQIVGWEQARSNYEGLKQVKTRSLEFGPSTEMRIQFNPARIRSSAAKVDPESIKERKCFLCPQNLPDAQDNVPFGDEYLVLVNPFPIFSRHLTIPNVKHIDQRIDGRLRDMMALAMHLPGFVLFYNGPKCGASAPDHFHFQAGNKGFLPIEEEFRFHPGKSLLLDRKGFRVFSVENYLRKTLVLEGDDPKEIELWFNRIYHFLATVGETEEEPMLNILCSRENSFWRVVVFPRKGHRPRQFYAKGKDQIVLSPASVDFGGVLITPREEDFEKLNRDIIKDIFDQVTLDNRNWENIKKVFKA